MIKQAHQLKIGDRILLTGRGIRTIAGIAVIDNSSSPDYGIYKFTFKEASPLVMESIATFRFEVVDNEMLAKLVDNVDRLLAEPDADDTRPIRIPQSIAEFYADRFLLK